tara:strand:+ start:887 stop:1240 length:354 start_codon:yes stop_codon:yes gene_type:complete
MAFTKYHNITGSTGVNIELLAPGDSGGNLNSITITNTHATADATVTLFVQNQPTSGSGVATVTYKILSTVAIPSDTSLILDNPSVVSFDNSSNAYGLYVTVGSSDTLDIILNRDESI